jgi:succinoglycan biosynthesis transport protein ExoP
VTRDQMRGSTSFIYGFSFEHSDPEKAAQVANAVASSFVEVNLARRTEQAHRTTTFLKEELARDEAALREHTRRLNEFRRDHRGQLPSDLNPHIAKLEALSTRRDSLVTQIATKENRIAQLLSESTETENETLLDDARAELARESAVHTDEHPNVRSLRRRVARLEELVAQERSQGATPSETTTRLTTSEELELRLIKKQLASTDDRIAELNQQIEKMPAVGEDAAALEEQVQQLREDYLKSLRKVEDAELAESLEAAEQGAQISVLDRAHAPSKPERTRVKLAVVGVAGALALGIGLGLLLELLDPVVVDAEHLARLSSHPVLGSVPRVG